MNSWDCFDTLVARRFYEPHSIFDEVGKRLAIDNFKKIRLRAEKNSGGTIEGIYKNLPDINPQIEFDVELEHCFGILENLNKVNDGDIIVSDMYFTSEQVHEILISCGLTKKVKVIVTPAGKKYGTIWPTLGNIDLHIGDNLRSDVESPSKFGIKSQHYTNHLFNEIEKIISEYNFDLACWSRYIRLRCPYTDQHRIQLWNDQANLNLPILALASLEFPEDKTIAFCYRDCAYWHSIYEKITGKIGLRFDVSRRCYANPSEYFNNYIKSILDQDVIIADMQGTGESVKNFYNKNQQIFYIIGNTFENIHSMAPIVPNSIERHNCTDIGPLTDWNENGPVRDDNEHDKTAIDVQSCAVNVGCESINWYKILKNSELLNRLIHLMSKNYTHRNVPYIKG